MSDIETRLAEMQAEIHALKAENELYHWKVDLLSNPNLTPDEKAVLIAARKVIYQKGELVTSDDIFEEVNLSRERASEALTNLIEGKVLQMFEVPPTHK
jgi:DNA repair ATPase RecN